MLQNLTLIQVFPRSEIRIMEAWQNMTLIKQLELSDIISHNSMFNFVNIKLQVLSLPLSSLSVTHGVSHHYHNGTTASFFVFTPCWTVDLRFHYHILSHLYHQALLGLPAHFCGQVIGPAVSWLWPPALSLPATTPFFAWNTSGGVVLRA